MAGSQPFELVMIQPTPYCNIQCSYCYLSEVRRNTKAVMSDEVLEAVCDRIFRSALLPADATVNFLWHAGEPLAVPIGFYENAVLRIAAAKPAWVNVTHSVLSNGIAVNERWCNFFKEHEFDVGLSIDGSERLHNANRLSRNGLGTFRLAERALQLLQLHGLDPYVLTTVHELTLDSASELFDFYRSHGVTRIGLNFEEMIGNRLASTFKLDQVEARVRSFLREFYHLYQADGSIFVREFDSLKHILLQRIDLNRHSLDTVTPLSIVTIDHEGYFSSFAPELADVKHPLYGDFSFGNVLTSSFEDAAASDKFRDVSADIRLGVEMCRASCEYFPVCGANLPAHKLAENGKFSSTETLNCRLSVKAVSDIVVDYLLQTSAEL